VLGECQPPTSTRVNLAVRHLGVAAQVADAGDLFGHDAEVSGPSREVNLSHW
jgi:hypothetical protein